MSTTTETCQITLSHPTDRPNYTELTIGPLELIFSYQTVIAFRVAYGAWKVSENLWGPTTGKHLNLCPGGNDKRSRIDRADFDRELAQVLARFGLSV